MKSATCRSIAGVDVAGRPGELPLELLGHPDRGHPGPAFAGQPVQVRAHHLELALALGECRRRGTGVGATQIVAGPTKLA
jgi:hypothetical protein